MTTSLEYSGSTPPSPSSPISYHLYACALTSAKVYVILQISYLRPAAATRLSSGAFLEARRSNTVIELTHICPYPALQTTSTIRPVSV